MKIKGTLVAGVIMAVVLLVGTGFILYKNEKSGLWDGIVKKQENFARSFCYFINLWIHQSYLQNEKYCVINTRCWINITKCLFPSGDNIL